MGELRSYILGEVGTYVSMTFEREENASDPSSYDISLMRGNAEYFGQLQQKVW